MADDLEQGLSSVSQACISCVLNALHTTKNVMAKASASKAIPRACRPTFILGFTVFVMFTWWLAQHIHAYYIFVRYGFQWFEESLPSASEVAGDLHALLKLSPYFL